MRVHWLTALAVLVAAVTTMIGGSSGSASPGATDRVSVSGAGIEGNGSSGLPAVSADGQFTSFSSPATNLVAGDGNGLDDVFLRDSGTLTTGIASVTSAGTAADGAAYESAISDDGTIIAFRSVATNLAAGDTNGVDDIFVHDRHPVADTNGHADTDADGHTSAHSCQHCDAGTYRHAGADPRTDD